MNSIPDFGDPGFDSLLDGFGFGEKQWKPHPRSRKILSRALEHINSVDYSVSVRWAFYRLLQDGVYSAKTDYDNFTSLTSRARHAFYGDWHPLILADETREMIISEHDGDEPGPDIEYLIELAVRESKEEREALFDEYQNYAYSCSYHVDPNHYQENIIIIMFEARAMIGQFKKYVPHGISLCPFGGQPSIPYKYTISQYIDRLWGRYSKPVIVLYFGDLDSAGITIFETGKAHISGWCGSSPVFIRCGLTEAQVEFYGIPENPDHPGYQWEALTDTQASEIITSSLSQYYDFDAARRAEEETREICEAVESAVNE